MPTAAATPFLRGKDVPFVTMHAPQCTKSFSPPCNSSDFPRNCSRPSNFSSATFCAAHLHAQQIYLTPSLTRDAQQDV